MFPLPSSSLVPGIFATFLMLFLLVSSPRPAASALFTTDPIIARNPLQQYVLDITCGTAYGWRYFEIPPGKRRIIFRSYTRVTVIHDVIYFLSDSDGPARCWAEGGYKPDFWWQKV